MRAVLCKEVGSIQNLVVEEVADLQAAKGKVVITVKACGVNFPDILVCEGKYQFKPPVPFSPGGEVAGIVKAVGEGVNHLKVGDRVFGGLMFGGFAEEVVGDANMFFPIPEGMDFVQASAIMMTYGTSYHALVDRANLQAGETLLVLGAAGGVGLAAVDIGVALGAKVIAAASTADKLAVCQAFGASEVINYAQDDLKDRIKEITQGRGVDVIYDPVGGVYSEPAFRSIAWNGRFLVVGFASDGNNIPKLPLNLPLLKGAAVVGVFWGSFTMREPKKNMQNFMAMMQMFQTGKLKAHIHATYPLERAVEALQEMAERRVIGKVVLVP
ncbi:MAG: NADPH:quinone oxidoreductase family protein [Microscillaceae bacterium]|jgi:NADPH2:quinone reductase|nr:NADPH:quinone oxidoreductase family protein [Microscillaceae bacterium]